jgi:phage N-6-adenine-methyltransferase
MGIGKNNDFNSNAIEYSTPVSLFEPLSLEFNLQIDVCASKKNAKLDNYWTIEQDALKQDWIGNCWMNPPFSRNLNKWVKKACRDSNEFGGTKVCLVPVRSNTKWWAEVVKFAEIRFIIGEVNFNEAERGLWLPMCILIFGEQANVGRFSTITYTK